MKKWHKLKEKKFQFFFFLVDDQTTLFTSGTNIGFLQLRISLPWQAQQHLHQHWSNSR